MTRSVPVKLVFDLPVPNNSTESDQHNQKLSIQVANQGFIFHTHLFFKRTTPGCCCWRAPALLRTRRLCLQAGETYVQRLITIDLGRTESVRFRWARCKSPSL